MQVVIGSDHAGYELKEQLKERLLDCGYAVRDIGTVSIEPVDYPDIAVEVAREVLNNEPALGILVCGTGIGMAITANKIPGIRAAVCNDTFAARAAREHNDANILAIGARILETESAWDIVKAFLSASFQGGRHARRVDKIRALESRYFK
ncbi:MAG: ribose 5-phosphate isomerase B [Syntrophomonadaceae bacterium]|nr:ribose 5-phosphate isomerase B [Syntrophomonadaceae bacterium]